MKLRALGIALILVMILACGFTVSGEQNSSPAASHDADAVLISRLENMLDHNQVYNDDFDSTNDMVNNSVIALLDKADGDGFIDRDIVSGFVYNMYGIDLSEYSAEPGFPSKDGHLFVIPKGYDLYDHTVLSAEIDGEYIHTDSVLTVDAHDGYTYELSCRSIFKVNESSSFGYNLISCVYY